jgi:hypothetical protein
LNSRLYPVLTLISRLDSDSGELMKPFENLIVNCMGCKIWKLRAMAARCLPCVLSPDTLADKIGNIFNGLKGNTQNQIHGGLMGIQRIAEHYRMKSLKDLVLGLSLEFKLIKVRLFLEWKIVSISFSNRVGIR